MISHYIRISLRNLRKYKTQTAVSICAMAVSLTLLAIVASILLSLKPMPLLDRPYAERTVKFQRKGHGIRAYVASSEDMSLIQGHPLKTIDQIHYIETGYGYPVRITAESDHNDEISLLNTIYIGDSGFLNFHGIRSVVSGEEAGILKEGETIITERLAKKLYGKENPVGKRISVHFFNLDGNQTEKTYTVRDVIENPSPAQDILRMPESLFVSEDHVADGRDVECFLVMREGASYESMTDELNELLDDPTVMPQKVTRLYSMDFAFRLRDAVIVFLFLFVLVAFSNYLRQQIQLFRLREREVALRTCVGCPPYSIAALFSTEVLIVLAATFALTLSLIIVASDFLSYRYARFFENYNYSLADSTPVALAAFAVLTAASLIAVAFTVRSIRRDQTGLALRMKPLPRHRLRNIGLTLQMTVSILFASIAVMLSMSGKNIKECYGIPEDLDRYKKYICVHPNGVDQEDAEELYRKVESLPSAERVYRFIDARRMFYFDEEQKDWIGIDMIFQNETDAEDFYGLNVGDMKANVNPERFVYVSEAFRKILIEKKRWNGKTLELPQFGEYDIKGTIDKVPFEEADKEYAVVVHDPSQPMAAYYDRVIMPKPGMEKKAFREIEDAIREAIPSRIDIKPQRFYASMAAQYDIIIAMMTVIYILSAVSVVTTMAAVYAGVSLDTRRRRKEMALRKLSGAGPKVIAMIFLRVYIVIVAVAALIALPLYYILSESVFMMVSGGIIGGYPLQAYVLGLLFIIGVTALTIAWKIRDIMRADPIEYLKE